MKKEEALCPCKDLLDAQSNRFVIYNVWCNVDSEKGASYTTAANTTLRHYYRDDVSTEGHEQDEHQKELLSQCPLPFSSPALSYYHALVHENSATAERARRLPNCMMEENQSSASPRIPHRLIFTHKDNLFNCSKSASNSTPLELYTMAENAKETVNIYSQIWDDLEFVFLTNDDCIHALNQTEPGLIPWFNNANLAGMCVSKMIVYSCVRAFLCSSSDNISVPECCT